MQIDNEITLPGYGAEEWVSLSNIQNLDYSFVVGFWKMYNKFLINLIKNIKPLRAQVAHDTEVAERKMGALLKKIRPYTDILAQQGASANHDSSSG